ncbi:YybH family protein [Kribbella ginsengisoli]
MDELEAFLQEVLPRHLMALDAFHCGDPELWRDHWLKDDSVTLFGGLLLPTRRGWSDVRQAFESVSARFCEGGGAQLDVMAASVSGSLAYLAAHETYYGSFDGGPIVSSMLRITQIYRRDEGAWKLAHRHADPPPTEAR